MPPHISNPSCSVSSPIFAWPIASSSSSKKDILLRDNSPRWDGASISNEWVIGLQSSAKKKIAMILTKTNNDDDAKVLAIGGDERK